MLSNSEVLIPYHMAYDGLKHLIKSISLNCKIDININIIGCASCDFDISVLQKITKNKINYIECSNKDNVEVRLYKYLSKSLYSSSVVIHTDVEILDFDPISEIITIGKKYKNVGMIGKNRMGRHVSAGGFLPPTMSSHFLYVNNISMSKICQSVLEEEHKNAEGFVYRDTDIFPTRAYLIAISNGIQCLSMPLSISSKLMHYNSSTRRSGEDVTILNNYDSIRSTQVDIDAGLITLRSKLKYSLSSDRPIVIIGIADDAISTMKYLIEKKIGVKIFFYEQFTPLHGSKVSGVPVISFSKACKLENPFFYICTPNYLWYVNFLQFAGLIYGMDYKVRLRHGHNLFDFEHMTYNPGVNNDLYVDNEKVIEPNNMFIDSPISKNLSFFHASNYIIVVFFHIIRSTIRKVFRKGF
jgi:hypothetical protein